MSSINNAIKINQAEKERKQAEEALVLANEELEKRVKERTLSLEGANKKLIAAKEFAETANQAKSIFLSKMSHELRTPMHSILGFTQLLMMDKKNPLADYQLENMKFVTEAGNHLLDLINEILDLSKIESGKNDLNIGAFDINPIVESVIAVFKPLGDEKRIEVQYKVSENDIFPVNVDPLRLKQVVFNLLSNAIKYNRPNGFVIISLEKQENKKVRLGVKDNGYGISKENQDKIFTPFERLDINSDYIEGTGIGLTITKKYAELMDGCMDFESIEGEGSFFYIDFPVSDKECETG